MFSGAAPTACVAAGNGVGFGVFGELVYFRWGGLIEPSSAPVLCNAVPVRPVDASCSVADAALTMGMYSANVGAGALSSDAANRSAGEIPSRDNSSRAASRSAALGADWWAVIGSPPAMFVGRLDEAVEYRRRVDGQSGLVGVGSQ